MTRVAGRMNMESNEPDNKLFDQLVESLVTMELAITKFHDASMDDEDDGTAVSEAHTVIVATCHKIIQLDSLIIEHTSKQLNDAERQAIEAIKRASRK